MLTDNLVVFIQGATAMGCLARSVFFLRFWQRARDRLFAIFALAFVVFAIHYVILVAFGSTMETAVIVYGVRAVAFALILLAIIDKNRTPLT